MTYTIEQQRENRRKWVAALRSGKYQQGRGRLRRGDEFCCLGVGCLALEVPDHGVDSNGNHEFGSRSERTSAPREFMEMVGLNTPAGSFGTKSLMGLNDSTRVPFSKIADIIEQEPEGLFVKPESK